MINSEFYNNNILKIYHDSKFNKLALLKRRFDCSVYIAIISLNDNSTTIINVEGIFTNLLVGFNNSDYFKNPDYTNRNIAIKANKELLNDYSRDFILVSEFKVFEVDFNRNEILLVTAHKEYKTTDKNRPLVDNKYNHYIVLNFEGEIVLYNQINKGGRSHDYLNSLQFLDHKTLFVFNYENHEFTLWDLPTKQSTVTKLIDYEIYIPNEDIYYEYVGPYALHRGLRLVAFQLENPTYGQDCIKIATINDENSLEFILSYTYQEPRLCEMVFNLKGDKIYIIEIIPELYGLNIPNVSICIYTFELELTLKHTISTKLNHSVGIQKICNYTAEIICIITSDWFFLYNIITGFEVGFIKREPTSPYYISTNKIFYLKNKKLYHFSIEDGELPVYPIEDDKQDVNIPVSPKIKEHQSNPIANHEFQSPKPRTSGYIRFLIFLLIIILSWVKCNK
ncbi:hypothetical protein [Mucilaginibacter sp.]